MSQQQAQIPFWFKISNWWAFGFALVFIIYGGVKMVLGFLDRNYNDVPQLFLFLILGIVLMMIAYAYRERKLWGWYGQIVINGLIIILALIGFRHYENIVLLVLAAISLFALFSQDTRNFLIKRQ